MLSTLTTAFEMPVWRVLPFADKPLLAIELRDAELLQAKFAVVELSSANLLMPPATGPEIWWIGLQAAAHDQLYLHLFEKQPQVGVSGLAAMGTQTDEQNWIHPGLALRGVKKDYLLAQPATDPEGDFLRLDPFSGRIIAEPETNTAADLEEQMQPVFPDVYLPENPHFCTLHQFLQLKLHLDVRGSLEYLETKKHIVFSFHLQEENGLANYLVVFGNSGHLRFRKRLNQHLKGFASDTFFLFQEKLVAVQDNTNLLIIDLQN